MNSKIDNSFIGNDGFRYVKISDELGYMRQSPSDISASLYYESYALGLEMLTTVENAALSEPARSFCIFSVKIAQLEQLLNEFYEAVYVLCLHPNPMATMEKPSAKQIRVWSNKEGAKAFTDLTLGQKHKALKVVVFITDEDKRQYENTMDTFDNLVENRNKIIHFMFDPKKSTKEKFELINAANTDCSTIITEFDKLDNVFRCYVLRNASLYYPNQN